MTYTEDQEKAIRTRGKNILVAAAAGSGKTRVLVDRIIEQLRNRECSIEEILILTFTRAAAAEMQERIEQALSKELESCASREIQEFLERQMILLPGAFISTFDSFCSRIIRQNITAVDIDPQFRIADQQEFDLLRRDTLEELMESLYERPENEEDISDWEEFIHFVDDYGDDRGDLAIHDAVMDLYRFAQSQPFPEAWLDEECKRYEREYASPWETPWAASIAEEALFSLTSMREGYAALSNIRTANAQEAFLAHWTPYAALIDDCVGQLDYMIQLIKKGLQEKTPGIWDEIGESILRFDTYMLGKKEFRPLKKEFPEQQTAFKDRRTELKKEYKKFADDTAFCEREEDVRTRLMQTGKTVRAYVHLVKRYMTALLVAERDRNAFYFDAIAHLAIDLLCRNPDGLMHGASVDEVRSDIAKELMEKFRFIMVDEYQDTNGVQEAILSLIAREDNLFIVGDVKQSIYRFRMADPSLFQKKYDSFPEKPDLSDAGKDQLITMKQNFRSRSEVLSPINFIFDQVMVRSAMQIDYDEKSRLYPGLPYEKHARTLTGAAEVAVICREEDVPSDAAFLEVVKDDADTEELTGFEIEAQYIANRILALIASEHVVFDKDKGAYRPIAYRDIAVLLRAVAGKANILLEVLQQNGIPAYAEISGGYFETSEIRMILSLLSLLDNARQDIPLAAIMLSPIGGFTAEDLARLRILSPEDTLYDALVVHYEGEDECVQELMHRTARFLARLSKWRSYAASHSVPEIIWQLYRDTGYYEYVGGLRGGVLRQANLRMLAERAEDYEATNYRGLFRFLRYIENLQKRETDLSTARTLGASENVVRIMTIHKSKGLEFPVVILSDMGKKFNLSDAKGNFLMHKALGIAPKLVERSAAGRQIYRTLSWQAVSHAIQADAKAEEMRVLYVAMTRAREKLILTGMVGQRQYQILISRLKKAADAEKPTFSDRAIRSANSYFDWVLPAILRHKDGKVLRELADVSSFHDCTYLAEDSSFSISVLSASAISSGQPEETEESALFSAIRCHEPLAATAWKEKVEACLGFSYDMHGLFNVPTKLSVTEIKKRMNAIAHEDVPMPERSLVEKSTAFERPHFLQEKTELSSMEFGTLAHTILQHLDLAGDLSRDGLKMQLSSMAAEHLVEGSLLTDARRECLLDDLMKFVSSKIGRRMQSSRKLYRELPFSRMMPAKRFFPLVEGDEKVFVQGIIDVLFKDEDGHLVLLDYKTDRDTCASRAAARYKVQIDIYSEAIEAILGEHVEEKYLYLLHDGTLVDME